MTFVQMLSDSYELAEKVSMNIDWRPSKKLQTHERWNIITVVCGFGAHMLHAKAT